MYQVDDEHLEDVPITKAIWYRPGRRHHHIHSNNKNNKSSNFSLNLTIIIALTSTIATILTTTSLFTLLNRGSLLPRSQSQSQSQHSDSQQSSPSPSQPPTDPTILVDQSLLKPYQIHHSPKYGPYITCPDPFSPKSHMLSSGCSFDLLANGWVPNPCFNSAMHYDFTHNKNFGFFEDLNGTRPISQETILQEGDVTRWPDGLFVTFHEHFEHCRYILNGSVRAVQPPFKGVLDMFHDEDHLLHCMHVLRQTKDAGRIETEVKAYFTVHKCYLSLT